MKTNRQFNPAVLTAIPKSSQVGVLIVHEPSRHMEHYECAAWRRQHELQPGAYPVYVGTAYSDSVPERLLRCEVATKIVGACLQSMFGGIGYGADEAGQREIGKASTFVLTVGGAWYMPEFPEHARGDLWTPPGCEFHWTDGAMKAAPIFND